jgi:sugar lactone lactonase YvrE
MGQPRRSVLAPLVAIFFGCATAHDLRVRPEELPVGLRSDAVEVASAFAVEPDDACVLYQVAALLTRAGRPDDALEALRRMAALGAGVDPRPRDGFAPLAANPEFRRIVAGIRAANPPVRRARPWLTIEEGDLLPEGIAWSTTTQRLYLGSAKRKIVALDREGRVATFVPSARDGLGIVLGIRVDEVRGELWATSGRLDGAPADAVSGLFRYRLGDGALLGRYGMPGVDALPNDVAVAPDGSVYATLTGQGAVANVDGATGRLQMFTLPGSVPDANGIAVSPGGEALFVAGWRGIHRIDIRTRRVEMLSKPTNVATGCFDGLYFYGDDLVGVQNCVHATGRIVRLHLDPTGRRIEGARVLESYNPLFDGVTTAAVVDGTLVFIANTQLRKLGTSGPFDPLHVLTLSLDGSDAAP